VTSPLLSTPPRLVLTQLPTPLEDLPRFSREVGVRVLIKRDDLTSLGLGGNKIRKLEYLMAEAVALGADTVVTGGGIHSNHARLTAAVARRLGLEPYLVFWGTRPAASKTVSGNLLLDHLLDAHMEFTGSEERASVDVGIADVCGRLRNAGRNPYAIPRGGATALGCLGYVDCARELDEQLCVAGIASAHVVVACGSGGTAAGLWAGIASAQTQMRLLAISVSRPAEECRSRIRRLGTEASAMLGGTPPERGPVITDRYLGPGYGVPTPEGDGAIQRLARQEGIFLDPIYTGKAMAALIDFAQQGAVPAGDPLVFIHTGGTPELFATQ
jgi:D-cysteine desulfhydrase